MTSITMGNQNSSLTLQKLEEMRQSGEESKSKIDQVSNILIKSTSITCQKKLNKFVGRIEDISQKYQEVIEESITQIQKEESIPPLNLTLQKVADNALNMLQETKRQLLEIQKMEETFQNELASQHVEIFLKSKESYLNLIKKELNLGHQIDDFISKEITRGQRSHATLVTFKNNQRWNLAYRISQKTYKHFNGAFEKGKVLQDKEAVNRAIKGMAELSKTLWDIGTNLKETDQKKSLQFFMFACEIKKQHIEYLNSIPEQEYAQNYITVLEDIVDKYIEMYPMNLQAAIINILSLLNQTRDKVNIDKVLEIFTKAFIPTSEYTIPLFTLLWTNIRKKLKKHAPEVLNEMELLTYFDIKHKIPSSWIEHRQDILRYLLLKQEEDVFYFDPLKYLIFKQAIPHDQFNEKDFLSFFLTKPRCDKWFEYADWIMNKQENEQISPYYAKLAEELLHFRESKQVKKLNCFFQFEKSIHEKLVFGGQEWAKYFGDIGVEPSLPTNIEDILNTSCTFWPDKKVKETHILVLIPNTVNGKSFTLNYLEELIQKPKSGHATKYKYYFNYVKNGIGEQSFPSHWVLITKDVIPGSKDKSYSNQCCMLDTHNKKTDLHYEFPYPLDATTSILMHYIKTGEYLYTNDEQGGKWAFTRCQDVAYEYFQGPFIIGGFSSDGIGIGDSFEYGENLDIGIAGASRL